MYRVEYVRSARRELEWLPRQVMERILLAVRGLQEQPRPRGSQKMVGSESLYRIRVGSYRVIYDVDDARKQVLITRVRHRKDAYQ